MIFGIGVDIVDVSRISKIHDEYGENFTITILTDAKFEDYKHSTSNLDNFLAKRFAAKEAFVKALGTGFSKDYSWSTIGYFTPTVSYGTSRPQVRLKQKLEGKTIHLSVSDEKRYVIAYVTIEETKNEQRSKLR